MMIMEGATMSVCEAGRDFAGRAHVTPPLLIEVRIDGKAPRQWHLRIIERLVKIPGASVCVNWARAATPVPSCIATLFALERLLNRLPRTGHAAPAARADFSRYMRDRLEGPDLVLDLCGSSETNGPPTWFVTFDGAPGEVAALAALLEGRMPIVSVVDSATGTAVATGRPGTETPGIILAAFEDCLARTTTLILAALGGRGPSLPQPDPSASSPASTTSDAERGEGGEPDKSVKPAPACGTIAEFTAKSLVRNAVHRLYALCCYAPHWRVGWRFVDGPDVIDLLGHPGQGWNELADDGFHFYADPFPIVIHGRTYVFVEDFDHRVGSGVISVVDFDAEGPVGQPRPVLATDGHLSYPFVFEHAGEIWMVPELSDSRSIKLYRATRFPDVWSFEIELVGGVEASDPTLVHEAGCWWLMATVRDHGGSFSDALYLWSAPALFGPWTPHAANPVLVDISAARPAGRCVRRNGRLIRPVQDCRRGYGVALGLAEVTRLDMEGFDQRHLATLQTGEQWRGRRLHTLNRAGSLECIDGSGLSIKAQAWWVQ